MTASTAVPDTTRAAKGAFWMLLLMVAFTACWLALTAQSAAFQTLSRAVTRPATLAIILYGLWLGLARAGFDFRRRLTTWLAIAIPYTLWLTGIWVLAVEGAFVASGGGGLPRLPIATFLPLLLFLPILLRSRRIGEILDATPPAWLVGLQLYRVFGGIFLVAWAQGRLSSAFALPAGIGDVTTGLLALPVAYYLSAGGRGGRQAAIAWNLFGLVDFTIALSIGILSSPGVHLIVVDRAGIGTGTYPLVMVPAFVVPSSIILHALSLRQLRRRAAASSPEAGQRLAVA